MADELKKSSKCTVAYRWKGIIIEQPLMLTYGSPIEKHFKKNAVRTGTYRSAITKKLIYYGSKHDMRTPGNK